MGNQPVTADRQVPLALAVLVAGLITMASAAMIADPLLSLGALLTGAILFACALMLALLSLRRDGQRRLLLQAVAGFVAGDLSPCLIARADGRITYRNRATVDRFQERQLENLSNAFADLFANPSAVLFRLQGRARALGQAREDIVTRRGHLRLTCQRIDGQAFLWRVDDVTDKVGAARGADAVSLPMLTAGPTGTILFMNEAARRLIGGRVRALDKIFVDMPVVAGRIHGIEGAEGLSHWLVAEVPGHAGRRELYLLPAEAAGESAGHAPGWDALEELPVPILKVALSGEILAASREARALLPMPVGPGTRLSDLLEGLGRPVIDWIRDVAEGRVTGHPQFLRGTGAHQQTYVRVSLSPSGQGPDRHLIAVLNDVTELKSLEAQFVQSQKMQAIGQLAGGVAHDFNNLLTAISGHCDLLLLRHDQADPEYADLIQIHQNANRAASLVGQLLAFSRKQNLMPEVLDLRDTLSDLTHLLNRLVGEKVTLTLNHDPDLLPIRADKRQLEQVLMNLVVNARDAMSDGGPIRISTENLHLREALERDRAIVPVGNYVVVKVEDDGCGIEPDKLSKIFEPFYTTKRPGEGTGLGLSTAYGIVKQTGGFIFADSAVGKGTTFSLYFPSCEREAPGLAASPAAVPTATPRKGEGVVLLVEDEAPVRAFASRALRLRGYAVLEADSAEAALSMLSDPALTVDIFVTDVIMPGKDGPTWVREALADRPRTKVIFVSGYAEDAFSEQKALIPNSQFLPKPFSLTDLTTMVHRQLQ